MTRTLTSARLGHRLGAATAGLQQMQAGVASGQLTMQEEDAQQLSAALATASDGASAFSRQVQAICTPAQLGTNAVSTARPDTFVGSAAGDSSASATLLQQYRSLLDRARTAVDAVLAGYTTTDDFVASD